MQRSLRTFAAIASIVALGCGESEPTAPASSGVVTAPDRVSVAPGQGERADALESFGDDLSDAVEIAAGVYQARGTGNAHLIHTSAGSVVFDTGLVSEADEHREKLLRAAPGPVKVLIVSHAHADHYTGFGEWVGDGVEVIAHADFPETQRYLIELVPFLMARNRIFYPNDVPTFPLGLGDMLIQRFYPQLEPTTLVDDVHSFELGGVRFEVIATPGAEGSDSVSLWLPDRKILFSGDFYGPIFPMWPNLDTPRGEKMRFAKPYIDSLDRIIALGPEMLVPSHFEPVVGEEVIREGLQRMRDAVAYVHAATVDGMNAGVDLKTLMREIKLPPELALSEGHGRVDWGVRAIWESYAGWWRDESLTELYPLPVREVYADLAELAGTEALVLRADEYLAAGNPVAALHLVEVALAEDPAQRDALETELAALELLLERSGGVNHHEVVLLDRQIERVREQLAGG